MLETMPKKQSYPQQELAERLVAAMQEADINLADLARGCGVTIQAVHDWRETGRIGKHHLVTIGRLTRKPLEYFLVGLGRAAAIVFVTVFMLLQPTPASAFSPAQFNNNTHCMQFLRRIWRSMVRSASRRKIWTAA